MAGLKLLWFKGHVLRGVMSEMLNDIAEYLSVFNKFYNIIQKIIFSNIPFASIKRPT